MFSRAEIAAWTIAVIGIVVMGFISLHGPFNRINVAHSAGSSTVTPNTAAVVHVKIVNNSKTIGQYVPEAIKVLGNNESIMITNASDATHTLTDRNGAFNTGDIAPGSTATITIRKPGVFHYYCIYHPLMTGTIDVLRGSHIGLHPHRRLPYKSTPSPSATHAA